MAGLGTCKRQVHIDVSLPSFHPPFLSLKKKQHFLKKIKEKKISPGWYGSPDCVPAYEPKGHLLNSQAGHMPGLQARSPVGGVQEATG